MPGQKTYNGKTFLKLANELSDGTEILPSIQSAYLCRILKEAMEVDPKGKIKNSNALDLIVNDLLGESDGKRFPNNNENFNEILNPSKRQILFDFLDDYLKKLGSWNLSNPTHKKEQPSLLKGMILTLVGQYEAAQIHFGKVAEIEPTSIMAWYGKAFTLEKQGRPEEALEALDISLKLEPENAIVLRTKARSLADAGELDQGIAFLLKSKRLLSAESSYHALLGILYIRKGDYDEAITVLEEGIWLDPKSSLLWILKAFSYVFYKKYDQAYESCIYALKFDSKHWQALYFIGLLKTIEEDHDGALSYYKRAAELAPEALEISLSIIQSLRSLNRIDEALDACEDLLKKNVKYAPAWEEKSQLFVSQQKWEDVIEICQSALKTCGDSDSAVLWRNLGGAYDNLNRFDLSIECFDKALGFTPDDPMSWFKKGSVLLKKSVVDKEDLSRRNSYIEEALKCGKRAVELNKEFGQGWYIYGLAYCQSGDMKKGLLLIEKAAKMGSFEAQILYQAMRANVNVQ